MGYPYLMIFLCLLCGFGEQTSTVIPDFLLPFPVLQGLGFGAKGELTEQQEPVAIGTMS